MWWTFSIFCRSISLTVKFIHRNLSNTNYETSYASCIPVSFFVFLFTLLNLSERDERVCSWYAAHRGGFSCLFILIQRKGEQHFGLGVSFLPLDSAIRVRFPGVALGIAAPWLLGTAWEFRLALGARFHDRFSSRKFSSVRFEAKQINKT